MKLTLFKEIDFLNAVKALFKELKVPANYLANEPTTAKEILKDTYKENSTFNLIDDVYFVGMVDDAAFDPGSNRAKAFSASQIKSDYDGILIFGITLNQRENNLLPTRSQLAEISRAFNREFYYTPVVLVFKYRDDANEYIAFANTERLKYKQEWREGEKAGKVSLLRDINIENPHRGHEDIINQLKIPTTGKKQIDSFTKLYNYWQEVFSVSILNKKFFQELSNWYFWAIKHVRFPNEPTKEMALQKNAKLEDLIQEHNATNVIRLLTRLLFTWFIKEKKLIPDELFDLDVLQQDILKNISPYHDENSLFKDANKESVYYKAILQNLFFATLNCPIKADDEDNRTRGFRGLESYGKHRGIDWMMRYKKYFKNPDAFLKTVNKVVPFLNGGLFECLDDKTQNLYIDGFSDQMTKGEYLVVPDYLFFGASENVDLSADYGVKNKQAKQAAVKGLINILKSYKFTITENTPIEEDVALDPELLGKVFENLLASYNPETKTTARKQTGSFYTPREIVNYMVDESLIAYLKNTINWNNYLNSSPDKGRWSQTGGVNNSSPDKGRWSKTGGVNNLPKLKTFRKNLRNNLTPAEAALWKYLQGKKLEGRKFRRQHSVANYILDFYCPSEKLAIELDGQGHFEATQAEYDYERDLFLKHLGIKVLRFENKVVWNNIEGLLEAVKKEFGWYDKQPPRPTDTPPLKGGELLDEKLHQLTSFDNINPFADYPGISKQIVYALDRAKILDPAAGSGAFPMGMLQKMVHILQKLDPTNELWKEVQLEKAMTETKDAYAIDDKKEREQKLIEINNAFDEQINDPDFARKLYLIENCIYGVDIQPIATQISKLRFFISLVVDQKVQPDEPNFGIRPLPNLETKFVTANTLIGLEKPDAQMNLFESTKVKELEKELKQIRHKLFNAKTKATKLKYRKRDEDLRNEIAEELQKNGWSNTSARQLASWDPYDQNASSPFFDPEWMFDIKNGFDVVIGNPPYIQIKDIPQEDKPYYTSHYNFATGRFNIFYFFIENSKKYSAQSGITAYIVPDRILLNTQTVDIRNWIITKQSLLSISSFDESVFDSAVVDSVILIYKNNPNECQTVLANPNVSVNKLNQALPIEIPLDYFKSSSNKQFDLNYSPKVYKILKDIKNKTVALGEISDTKDGIIQSKIPDVLFLKTKENSNCKPLLFGKNVGKFDLNYSNDWVHYNIPLMKKIELERGGGGLRMRIPEIFEREKILTRQTADSIIGAIDREHYYYSNTLHGTAITNPSYKIEYILGILNSSLMKFYYRATTAEGGKVFAQIKIELLRQLPIRYSAKQDGVVIIVRLLTFLYNIKRVKLTSVFIQVLDSIIFNLYFPDHMKEREIDVLEYVERDIASVYSKLPVSKQKPEAFYTLSDSEKEEIINQLHQKWTDPNNEVVKRMAQFKEKSPDILKVILES